MGCGIRLQQFPEAFPAFPPFETLAFTPVFPFGCDACIFKQAGKGSIANLNVFAFC